MKKLVLEKALEERAFELIKEGLENEDVLRKFSEISSNVCACNDVFIAYAYAERISPFCYGNKKFMDAMHIKELQKIVIDSGNEEYMYNFGTRVCGAELESLISAMPYGGLRRKLEIEATPIDELSY